MDKLITAVIIIAVAFFFYRLHSMGMGDAGGVWMATVGIGEQAHGMGPYGSRDACSAAVREAMGANVMPYSCALHPGGH